MQKLAEVPLASLEFSANHNETTPVEAESPVSSDHANQPAAEVAVTNNIIDETPPDHKNVDAAKLTVQGLIKNCPHFTALHKANPQAAKAEAAQIVEKAKETEMMRQQGKTDKEIKEAQAADDLAWAKSMAKTAGKDAKREPNRISEPVEATAKSVTATETVPKSIGSVKAHSETTKRLTGTSVKKVSVPLKAKENKNATKPAKPRHSNPETAATPKETAELPASRPTSFAGSEQTKLIADQRQSTIRHIAVQNAQEGLIEASTIRAANKSFTSVKTERSITSAQSVDKIEASDTYSHEQAVDQLAVSADIDPLIALRDTIRQLHDSLDNETADGVSDIAEQSDSTGLKPESTDGALTLQEPEFPSAEMDNGEETEDTLKTGLLTPASELAPLDPDYIADKLTHDEAPMMADTYRVAEVTIGEAAPQLVDSEYTTELKSELQDPEAYTGELSDKPQEFENGQEDFTLYFKQTGHEKTAAEAASGVENDSLVPANAPESANVDWDVAAEIVAMQTVLEDIEATMNLAPKQTELVQPGSAAAIDVEGIMIDQETLKPKLVELLERLQELEVKGRSGNDRHFAEVRETLQQMIDELTLDDENVEYLSKRLGTSEFVLRMRQILTDLQDAAARAYRLGVSLLRLYALQRVGQHKYHQA